MQDTLTIPVVVLALLFGAVFVRRRRVLWDDLLLLMSTFLRHPSVEDYVKAMASGCARPPAWRNLIFGIFGAEEGQP